MRTKEEIKKQIDGLTKMKTWLPEISAFGDNNWRAIDVQIKILKREKTADDYEDAEDNVTSAAFDAEDWLGSVGTTNLFDEQTS